MEVRKLNELLNYLNNYTKNRKNKQRFSAIMVCLAVIVSFTVSVGLIEPAESASGELICGMEEHEHTQDCFELICGFDEETEEDIVVETTLSDSEETTESTTLTEETTTAATEPATTETATTDTETTETIISTCTDESVPAPVHIHNDECYRLICLTEAHLHKQDCYNQPAETEPAATETFTSTSTETDTTATTEQTAETTTTTTELPEEIYELNPDTFGELYKDRVNILADETEEAGYKFYYTGGEANQLYAHDYFTYHNTATGEPSKNIVRTYNGNTYSYAYNFNGVNSNRYVSVKTESNGVLILIFGDGDNFKVKVLNEATNQSTEKEFKSGDDGIMVVPVVQGVNYKVTQSGGTTNARLVYSEFIPAVEPKNGGNYRIRNVKTGLYIEMGDIVKVENQNKQYIQQGGNTPSDDKRNDFKLNSTRDNYYQILPQRDTSKAVDYSKNDKVLGTYRIKTLDGDKEDIKNQEFNFIRNTDGTYKIYTRYNTNGNSSDNAYCWEIFENGTIVNAAKNTTNLSQDFIFVEATEITYPPANIDGKTYLIKNVRSRQYIHMEEKVEIKDANGNVTQTLNNQIIQQKDIGTDSKFKFVSTGTAGEYYIVSAYENYALTTGQNIINGTDVKYSEFNRADNQKFYAEQMENGSIRFYQIDNNGKKFYLEINGQSTNTGADVDLWDANKVNDHQCFFIVPVVAPEEVPEANTRVEARVIFADYNDGKIDENTRNLYDEPAWIPTFSLYKNGNLEENKDGNLVVDVSSARKDWCYQYNYVWNLGESNTIDKYYVALNGVNNKQITLNGKTFRVHYLKDTELGHPGQCNKNDPYSQSPSDYNQTGDQIIYIFLDPVVEEWWPNGEAPRTFDLSMKKRWDGHNASGYDNRPKEKIKIQLQRLKDGKWVEYKPEDFGETYTFKCYFEVVDVNGKNKRYVDLRAFLNYKKNLNIPYTTNVTNIKRTLTNNIVKYTIVYNNETYTFSEDDFNYEDLKNHNCLFEKESETHKRANLELGYNEWNNVVLTVDGNNNPTHFTNGYYFNWKAIPYGQYRVIETQSFYDANDNNVLDAGDRDTSQEYYYMSYPPMRDSRGVLHIQNFTKDMVIEVQKKWQDDEGGDMTLTKPIEFEVYRCLGDPRNSVPENLDLVGKFTTNENGYAFITSREKVSGEPETFEYYYNVDNMETKNGDTKYHYFIKEIVPDGYKLINGNEEGYVLKNGSTNDYSVDYEDGDSRKFIITNKAKIGLRVEKEWYNSSVSDENKIDYYNNNTDNPIYPKFKIYKGDRPGTPVVNDDICSVNDVALEEIAEVTIGKDGYFELVSDANDVHGDSSNVNNKLNMLSDTKIALTLDTDKEGNYLRIGSGMQKNENGIISFKEENIMWFGSKNKIQPYISGTLTFVIADFNEANYTDSARIEICEKTFNSNNQDTVSYKIKGSGGKINIPNVYIDGNCRVQCKECDITINNVYFTNNAYYYIQEIKDDNYTLSNGDSNGFVKIGDNFYTTITANNHYPVVTAQNIPKVNLDITKEWTQSNANISKAMNFEIYKAFANGEPVADDKGYKVTVNNLDYQLTKMDASYQTDSKGVLTVENLPAFEEKDESYHKLYYYVREVEGNYTITNTDAKNGFIPYESEKYGTAFDDTSSNSGKYKFTNTPKLDLTVNKIWKNANGESYNAMVSTEIKFKVYRKIENGEFMPVPENGTDYVTSGLKKVIEGLDAYDENGNIYTYYIKEIDGETYFLSGFNVKYNNQTNPEECAFSWNKDGEKPVINITNQAKPQNYELPETGGSGTHGCTAAGGTIVLLSATILLLKRRKKMV